MIAAINAGVVSRCCHAVRNFWAGQFNVGNFSKGCAVLRFVEVEIFQRNISLASRKTILLLGFQIGADLFCRQWQSVVFGNLANGQLGFAGGGQGFSIFAIKQQITIAAVVLVAENIYQMLEGSVAAGL